MRRVIMLISVCALLWGCLLTGAHAQQVSIANDNNLLDISLRDADLSTVLTALFNSTGGKYRLQLSNGVNGRIARLQLTQTPFDRALDAILGTDFSYTKQMQGDGVYQYTISGRSALPTTRMPSVFQAPDIGMPAYGGGTTPTAPAGFLTPAGGANPAGGSGLLSLGFGATGATTAGETAASESSVVKLIRVNYLDVGLLSEALGGTSLDLFELLQSANGDYGGGGGGRSGGGRSGNNRSGYDNNGYNSNYNNDNNNNNNNRNNNNNNNNNNRNSSRNNRSNR